jgi:predicted acylesterase/phospholipase RssA
MNSNQWKPAADLIIEPDVNGYKYDAFEHSAALVKAGEMATRAALPEIRKWLKQPHCQNLPHPAAAQAD